MPALATTAAPAPSWFAAFRHRLRTGDEFAHVVTAVFASAVLLIAALIFWELWSSSVDARHKFGLGFVFGRAWDPVAGQFGALPFIYGTLVTSAVALVLSVPIGLGAAIFLSELAPPRISSVLTFVIELLAAVPSVIFGLIGIFTIVPLLRTTIQPALQRAFGYLPLFKGPMFGVGYLAAGLVLAVMTVPFVVSISREALLAVPRDQREGALAVGATQWEAVWQVVVPHARLGIIGSVFLALARALGETMAVTMVIGNDPRINASLFAPGYSVAAVIANEFTEATGNLHIQALVLLGLVLFLLTFVLNGVARLLVIATSGRGTAQPR